MQVRLLGEEGNKLDDRAVVSRVLTGERDLFELLMRRYNQRFFRLARAYVTDSNEAEDVVQEAYVQSYSNLDQFSGSSFGAWVARIVINEALGRLRRKSLKLINDSSSGTGFESEPEQWAPDQLAGREQMLILIEAAVDRLPQDFRVVFMLRVVEQLSVVETAAYLNINPVTVKTRLFRAKALLQTSLSRYLEEISGDAFGFGGTRCDRIVASVQLRLACD